DVRQYTIDADGRQDQRQRRKGRREAEREAAWCEARLDYVVERLYLSRRERRICGAQRAFENWDGRARVTRRADDDRQRMLPTLLAMIREERRLGGNVEALVADVADDSNDCHPGTV